ncbi:MAG: NADAR family protein [Hyphomicrobiaceae bacterium]
MRALLTADGVRLEPENDAEAAELSAWGARLGDHMLMAERHVAGEAMRLTRLGRRADVCREPINITSTSPDPAARLMSNFGDASFEMDGEAYRSVESFWQGLKFSDPLDRRRIAALNGREAQAAGEAKGYGTHVTYAGAEIPVGTWAHWQLMERACRAKFAQCGEARAALLATGIRPLEHVLPRDSRAIPGVIMAEIWMRIRRDLQAGTTPEA